MISLLLPLLFPSALPSTPAASPGTLVEAPLLEPSEPVAAGAQDEAPFMQLFRQAMRINAKDEMATLVRRRQMDAIHAIIEICEQIAAQSNDQLEAEIAALREAWRTTFDTDFVDLQYEFFSLLRPEFKKERDKLRRIYDKALRGLEQAKRSKEAEGYATAGLEFRTTAEGFEKIGDKYLASQAWINYATCFDEGERGKDADLKRAFEGYSRGAENRLAVGLKDRFYTGSVERAAALERAGHGDPTKGEAAERAKKREAESSAGVLVATTQELFSDLDGVVRPAYNGIDSMYPTWLTVMLAGVGSTAEFPSMQGGPRVVRTASSTAMIDVDRDGTGDVEIPLTGNITPVTFTLGTGDAAQQYSILTAIGQQQDTYQGFRFNLGPADDQLSLYVAPASARVGSVDGVEFRVLDDNLDGKYGSDPIDWGHIGVLANHFQKDMDSVLFAGDKRARPWSKLQKVGEGWYHFTPEEDGTKFSVYRTEVEEGQLKLAYKGGKPDWVIVKGVSATNSGSYFDLASAAKVDVPEGTYELYCGQISAGKRDQKAKALFLPDVKPPSFDVKPGETVEVELGAPFDFHFEVEQEDETVAVVEYTVAVQGRGGEIYQRLWNCVPQPDVLVRPEGKKKGAEVGKLKPATSQEEVSDSGDYRVAWFPRGATFPKKKVGETLEVQLFEKKNKLFGKIESSWRSR